MYQMMRKDRDKQGVGILVYYSESYSISLCSCLKINLCDCKTEILWFIILSDNILVITVYHPYWGNSPFHSIIIDFLVDIVTHCREIHSVRSILLCGDLNGLSESVFTIHP